MVDLSGTSYSARLPNPTKCSTGSASDHGERGRVFSGWTGICVPSVDPLTLSIRAARMVRWRRRPPAIGFRPSLFYHRGRGAVMSLSTKPGIT